MKKGISYVISASKALPGVTFLVAGDGPDREALTAQIDGLGVKNVQLLGRIDSIPTLLAAADIACVPSLTEGQGIFALEAMAAGLPVVASNVGGLPEMIEDGVTGLLIPPSSPDAIATAISQLRRSHDLRTRLGLAAQAKAQAIGNIDDMIASIEAVYESTSPGR